MRPSTISAARDRDLDALARFSEAAALAAVPACSSAANDALVRVAIIGASVRRARRARWRTMLGAVAVAFAIGGGVAFTLRVDQRARPSTSDDGSRIARIALPTGDRITHRGAGELSIDRATRAERVVSIDGGEALFDVAPLGGSDRFEVITPHITIRVVGTVFAVAVDDDRTRVQVFEGVVRVLGRDARSAELGRDDTFDSAHFDEADAWRSSFYREGTSAARERALAASRSARSSSSSTDASLGALSDTTARSARAVHPFVPIRRPAVRAVVAPDTLDDARRACAAEPPRAAPCVELADALRGAHAWSESADAYERAASLAPPSRATSLGYLAAYLRLSELGDPHGALRALDESGSMHAGSPIEERATVLAIRAHLAANESARALELAHVYLARFPAGASSDWIEHLESGH